MLSYFCPACGTLTLGNTVRLVMECALQCSICGFAMMFQIKKEQVKTSAEVDAIFQATELTDKKAVMAQKRRALVHKKN